MIDSFLTKLRTFKGGMEMLPPLVEGISLAVSESRISNLLANPRYADPKCLARHRFKVFSQYGQDGMIAEIFRRTGSGSRRFVEIGTAPLENNTGFLLFQGWSGLWLDAALPADGELPGNLAPLIAGGKLRCERRFLTRDNVGPILTGHGFDSGVDFLSVDLDYNTFHVFAACLSSKPRVVSVEYNGQLPPDFDWVAPYIENAVWDKSLAYGASLKALERKASEGGYSLVGCELSGSDAFFVRNDLLGDHFLPPFTSEQHWEPLRIGLDSPAGHKPAYPRIAGQDAR
ncbi:MAG: hypothetical protein WC003_16410 [Terrimicrobiaceae bacterium]